MTPGILFLPILKEQSEITKTSGNIKRYFLVAKLFSV
jgi:hypothetical protein